MTRTASIIADITAARHVAHEVAQTVVVALGAGLLIVWAVIFAFMGEVK